MRHLYLSILSSLLSALSISAGSIAIRQSSTPGKLTVVDGTSAIATIGISTNGGSPFKFDVTSAKVSEISERTYQIDYRITARENSDDARIAIGLRIPMASDFWMIPAISYNGNHWGRGLEPKGAQENGAWRSYSSCRTPIPGAMYSESGNYAFATWANAPANESKRFSCSLQPDSASTRQLILWPEEEQPTMYSARDKYAEPFRRTASLKAGESLDFTIYVNISPREPYHGAMQSFLTDAWSLAKQPKIKIFNVDKLWDLGIRFVKESLWATEGSYRGLSIGLVLNDKGQWKQRDVAKYEIGWCGQNASFAISLMADYLKTGSKESLDKALATLDTWANNCILPNGLFITHYDDILYGTKGVLDGCNLGTAATNFFEAYNMAKQCGANKPNYLKAAYGICDFMLSDQQPDGCFGKGWDYDGKCLYREGTIGCFIVPAMIAAYHQSDDNRYLESAKRAFKFYMDELKRNGYSTAGALDTWCIDKESSITLLRSAIRLYRITNDHTYVDDAVLTSYYLSTWLWHYDEKYPKSDVFTRYGYHTFGATSVSTQHHHLDVYALYWVPEWIELAEITGDKQWHDKAMAIWYNSNQLISDGTTKVYDIVRPAGSQNEAYFESYWGFGLDDTVGKEFRRINNWLVAWPCAFRLETIRRSHMYLSQKN